MTGASPQTAEGRRGLQSTSQSRQRGKVVNEKNRFVVWDRVGTRRYELFKSQRITLPGCTSASPLHSSGSGEI